jgi:hypothetical protein
MKTTATLALGIISIFITGCSSNTLIKSQNMSASGIAYADSVNELLDETIKQVIDFDSKELLKTRAGSSRKKMLKEKNESLGKLIKEINHFRYQTSLMKNYFINLQALAESTVADDIGVSVGEISGTIQHLNHRPKDAHDTRRINKQLTEEDEGYIAMLTGMMVRSHFAANIEATLKRDAPVIGTQLLLQEKQLNHILSILQDRLSLGSRIHLVEKVRAPYIDTEMPIEDEETWIIHRREWFEMQQAASVFSDVKEAHKALRVAWEDILRGKQDVGSVSTMLEDVNEFVSTLHALDESRNRDSEELI